MDISIAVCFSFLSIIYFHQTVVAKKNTYIHIHIYTHTFKYTNIFVHNRVGHNRTSQWNSFRAHLSNFISSANDRKRRKYNKIKQLYDTTQRNEKHRQTFVHSLNPVCQITSILTVRQLEQASK